MIKGITSDSREVRKGFVFVAIKGLTVDGHDYINEAINKGAVKVYGEENIKGLEVPYVKVKNSRKKLAELAAEFYSNPSKKLKVIGVTGTKGKTTTVHMIAHILEKTGHKVGLISSVSDTGFHITSPDIVYVNKYLAQMVKEKKEYVVLEVSSHGIDQERVGGIDFDVTVLTNIKPEHLDYHKNFAEYKKIKTDWFKTGKIQIKSPEKTDLNIFPGEFNNINAETAILVAEKLKITKKNAEKALKSFKLPVGRMEEIETDKGFRVFVDFAHTPDSLEKALTYLKSLKPKRLISVFGCAGERDPFKRPKMGKISTQIADISIFTSEDPRSEDIFEILKQMEKGADKKDNYVSIPERGEAIAYALSKAKKGDIIGIFGKGHETSMCWGKWEYPWSDQKTMKALLEPEEGVSAIVMAAGIGSRMKSKLPKVLHKICGRTMISLTIENLRRGGIEDIGLVVGFKKELVKKHVGKAVCYAVQQNPKGGTADAVRSGLSCVSDSTKYVLALYGDDSAFFKPYTTGQVIQNHIKTKSTISFVSAVVANPTGLGRVVRGNRDEVLGIVEEKDTDSDQKKIKEVNCGHFIFDKDWLKKNISKVKVSPSGEKYIVDLIKMAIDQNKRVSVYRLPDRSEWQGINNPQHLINAEAEMEKRLKIYAKSI